MYKVKEAVILRNYGYNEDNEPIELCVEGYRLDNDVEVMYIGGKWLDYAENEYTPVTIGKIVGFNCKNTLDKELLSKSPEGRAYIEYNERIGGDTSTCR